MYSPSFSEFVALRDSELGKIQVVIGHIASTLSENQSQRVMPNSTRDLSSLFQYRNLVGKMSQYTPICSLHRANEKVAARDEHGMMPTLAG